MHGCSNHMRERSIGGFLLGVSLLAGSLWGCNDGSVSRNDPDHDASAVGGSDGSDRGSPHPDTGRVELEAGPRDGGVRDIESPADMPDAPPDARSPDASTDGGPGILCDIRGVWELRMQYDGGGRSTDTIEIVGTLGAERTNYPATSIFPQRVRNDCSCPEPVFMFDPAICTMTFRFWSSTVDEDPGECLVNDYSMELVFGHVENELAGTGRGLLSFGQFCEQSEGDEGFDVEMHRKETQN